MVPITHTSDRAMRFKYGFEAEEYTQHRRPRRQLARQGKIRLELEVIRERLLFEFGQDHAGPSPSWTDLHAPERIPERDIAGRQAAVTAGVLCECEPDLCQVVLASSPPRLLARGLHGGQKQRDQRPDDRDDHQELDKGETR